MMAGRPVVALSAGAAAEVVVDGETGLLVPEDPEALAAGVSDLLADPDRACSMGEAGRRRYVERFSGEAMADSFEKLMRELGSRR